jgi:hypothetical protein
MEGIAMRATKIVVLSLGLVIGVHVASAHAAKWDLRRVTTSAVCHVQPSDSSPPLGVLMKAYDTRKEACQEAKKQNDSSMSDPKKCWSYGSGTKTGCKADGVDL